MLVVKLLLMAEPFIHHLHTIYVAGIYTYTHLYESSLYITFIKNVCQ